MSLFVWKKSYEIGDSKVDLQHQHLIGLINELASAMMKKEGYQIAAGVIGKLEDYVQLHFTTEEELMLEVGYPELECHRTLHLDFTTKLLEFKKEVYLKESHVSSDLLKFLCDWFKTHISTEDKKIKAYIDSQEVS
jgi:hemerythrin-like metal-binding protein